MFPCLGYCKRCYIRVHGDFLGGPVIENPPFGVKDTGSIHDQETKIPCASGQQNPHAITREVHEPQLLSSCSATKACPAREAHVPQWRISTAKIKKKKKKLGCIYLFKLKFSSFLDKCPGIMYFINGRSGMRIWI